MTDHAGTTPTPRSDLDALIAGMEERVERAKQHPAWDSAAASYAIDVPRLIAYIRLLEELLEDRLAPSQDAALVNKLREHTHQGDDYGRLRCGSPTSCIYGRAADRITALTAEREACDQDLAGCRDGSTYKQMRLVMRDAERERDAAIARAEKAEGELSAAEKTLELERNGGQGAIAAYHAQLDSLGAPLHRWPCVRVGRLVDGLKARLTKYQTALRRMISEETDWENGEIGVGNVFRAIARAALDEQPADEARATLVIPASSEGPAIYRVGKRLTASPQPLARRSHTVDEPADEAASE